MKERIYTIPLTDAVNKKCGCILCVLEENMENDAVGYFLGPSLMEPDGRTVTNEKGFCRRHMNMLLKSGNRLGMALTLETHTGFIAKKLSEIKKKGLFFSKMDSERIFSFADAVCSSCALCDKLNAQIEAAAQNLAFLIDSESDFKDKFDEAEGLCLPHMSIVLREAEKELRGKKLWDFSEYICKKQQSEMIKLRDELHEFAVSFDYRHNGEAVRKEAVESVPKAVKKLNKY